MDLGRPSLGAVPVDSRLVASLFTGGCSYSHGSDSGWWISGWPSRGRSERLCLGVCAVVVQFSLQVLRYVIPPHRELTSDVLVLWILTISAAVAVV